MTPDPDPRRCRPRNIAVAGRELALAWADGHESYYDFERLRRECPCAFCGRQGSESSGPAPGAGISITRLVPVGAYAVQIVWSDGHDTGIYSFEWLRRACGCAVCRE